jgi:Flp pilus assembly protein TadG
MRARLPPAARESDMVQVLQITETGKRRAQSDGGQTIVIFVILIVGLLAFTGLAVDAGFIFARSSQFSSAVDAAALAGVVEMDPTAPTLLQADARALQFLEANGWPSAALTFVSTSTLTLQGFPEYTITVTWPVETYFMRVLGFRTIDVTHSATAVYMAQTEIFTPTYYEYGQMRKAAQFIMGPDSCTNQGDPISSNYGTSAAEPNTDTSHFNDSIRYRIRVPVATYTMTNRLRVELFDSDSANYNQSVGATVTYSNYYRNRPNDDDNGDGMVERSCATDSIAGGGTGQQCVFRIEDLNTLERFNQNPLWFVRVDENYDSSCNPVPDDPNGNTITEFRLYYLEEDGREKEIARYTESNHLLEYTDMKWYSPPGFEFALDPIPVADGSRYVYLGVKTIAGSGKNVWDLWAGPPSTAASLPNNVNFRNLYVANHPIAISTGGVQIYALGRLPLQHFAREPATIPLVPIPSSLSGGTIYASVFDYEGTWPLNFTINTVPTNTFFENVYVVDAPPEPNPLAIPRQVTCGGDTNCNADWTMPQVRLGIPSSYFFGGTLFGTMTPATDDGRSDEHTWMLSATAGRPFLTR